jgi:hypothetical protein
LTFPCNCSHLEDMACASERHATTGRDLWSRQPRRAGPCLCLVTAGPSCRREPFGCEAVALCAGRTSTSSRRRRERIPVVPVAPPPTGTESGCARRAAAAGDEIRVHALRPDMARAQLRQVWSTPTAVALGWSLSSATPRAIAVSWFDLSPHRAAVPWRRQPWRALASVTAAAENFLGWRSPGSLRATASEGR